ncbi:MAG: hypothetical protein WA667_16205 [Candidatus Nitrosopolaris sp.]
MIKVGEFGYFFIRYIERYYLDDSIGTERDAKSQIWYIPNQAHLSEARELYLNNLENIYKYQFLGRYATPNHKLEEYLGVVSDLIVGKTSPVVALLWTLQ